MPSHILRSSELQGIMRALDCKLEQIHGERIGVTLFVFELGKEGGTEVAYVSNAERADMIATVKAWLVRVEAGMTSDPPGPLGRA